MTTRHNTGIPPYSSSSKFFSTPIGEQSFLLANLTNFRLHIDSDPVLKRLDSEAILVNIREGVTVLRSRGYIGLNYGPKCDFK